MMPSAHLYGHHQFNPQADSAWMHQQPGHHQHAQQAAAAAAQQQQQQYNRMNANAQSSVNNLAVATQEAAAAGDNVSEENRRTMGYIAELLNEATREAALLELSKKREQVPELALILWHSFGRRFWTVLHALEDIY